MKAAFIWLRDELVLIGKWMVMTKIGWAFTCFILFNILMYFGAPEWTLYAAVAWPVILTCLAIGYAIHNSYIDWRTNRKMK